MAYIPKRLRRRCQLCNVVYRQRTKNSREVVCEDCLDDWRVLHPSYAMLAAEEREEVIPPEEFARRVAEVQATWTPEDERRRRGGDGEGYRFRCYTKWTFGHNQARYEEAVL